MLLKIPLASAVVPGDGYKGFRLVASSDPRADDINEIDSDRIFLARPDGLVYNNERRGLNTQGIILGIGIAFALKENPGCVPEDFKGEHRRRPVKLLTSTMLLSDYDKRIYVAYFYFANGEMEMSFIADDWASTFPSPAIPAQ